MPRDSIELLPDMEATANWSSLILIDEGGFSMKWEHVTEERSLGELKQSAERANTGYVCGRQVTSSEAVYSWRKKHDVTETGDAIRLRGLQ